MKEQIEQLENDITECYGCDPMYYGTDGNFLAKELVKMGWRKQKEGEWIEKSEDQEEYYEYTYKCSICGHWAIIADEGDSNFCPNCGSKMKGGAE